MGNGPETSGSYGRTVQRLTATPDTCFWGYFDPDERPIMKVEPGEEIVIEAVTHHAGDAPTC